MTDLKTRAKQLDVEKRDVRGTLRVRSFTPMGVDHPCEECDDLNSVREWGVIYRDGQSKRLYFRCASRIACALRRRAR